MRIWWFHGVSLLDIWSRNDRCTCPDSVPSAWASISSLNRQYEWMSRCSDSGDARRISSFTANYSDWTEGHRCPQRTLSQIWSPSNECKNAKLRLYSGLIAFLPSLYRLSSILSTLQSPIYCPCKTWIQIWSVSARNKWSLLFLFNAQIIRGRDPWDWRRTRQDQCIGYIESHFHRDANNLPMLQAVHILPFHRQSAATEYKWYIPQIIPKCRRTSPLSFPRSSTSS